MLPTSSCGMRWIRPRTTWQRCSRMAHLLKYLPQMIEPGYRWPRMAIRKRLYHINQKLTADGETEWEPLTTRQGHCAWGQILILPLQILTVVFILSATRTLPVLRFFRRLDHPIQC